MQVFISWSGERSRNIAEALNWFLPRVINTIEPWMSAEGIDPGVRWNADIASHLETTNFGIICLTSTNLEAPWIYFEAGAISKFIDKSYVVPYLLDIKPTDIVGPLTQFQSKMANKTDIKKIIEKIYKLSYSNNEFRTSFDVIKDTYEKYWDEYKEKIEVIPSQELPESQKRQPDEMLAEMLELLRSLNLKENSSSRNIKFSRELTAPLSELHSRLESDYSNRRLKKGAMKPFPFLQKSGFSENEIKASFLVEVPVDIFNRIEFQYHDYLKKQSQYLKKKT